MLTSSDTMRYPVAVALQVTGSEEFATSICVAYEAGSAERSARDAAVCDVITTSGISAVPVIMGAADS